MKNVHVSAKLSFQKQCQLGGKSDFHHSRDNCWKTYMYLPTGSWSKEIQPMRDQAAATSTRLTLQHTKTRYTTLQHPAAHCNTLQHIPGERRLHLLLSKPLPPVPSSHCNTLQHTATHCTTLPHAATRCNTLQHTATHTRWRKEIPCMG